MGKSNKPLLILSLITATIAGIFVITLFGLISHKAVSTLGYAETIQVQTPTGLYPTEALIDSTAAFSSIPVAMAKKLQIYSPDSLTREVDNQITLTNQVKIRLDGKSYDSLMSLDEKTSQIILGRDVIGSFFIDPSQSHLLKQESLIFQQVQDKDPVLTLIAILIVTATIFIFKHIIGSWSGSIVSPVLLGYIGYASGDLSGFILTWMAFLLALLFDYLLRDLKVSKASRFTTSLIVAGLLLLFSSVFFLEVSSETLLYLILILAVVLETKRNHDGSFNIKQIASLLSYSLLVYVLIQILLSITNVVYIIGLLIFSITATLLVSLYSGATLKDLKVFREILEHHRGLKKLIPDDILLSHLYQKLLLTYKLRGYDFNYQHIKKSLELNQIRSTNILAEVQHGHLIEETLLKTPLPCLLKSPLLSDEQGLIIEADQKGWYHTNRGQLRLSQIVSYGKYILEESVPETLLVEEALPQTELGEYRVSLIIYQKQILAATAKATGNQGEPVHIDHKTGEMMARYIQGKRIPLTKENRSQIREWKKLLLLTKAACKLIEYPLISLEIVYSQVDKDWIITHISNDIDLEVQMITLIDFNSIIKQN